MTNNQFFVAAFACKVVRLLQMVVAGAILGVLILDKVDSPVRFLEHPNLLDLTFAFICLWLVRSYIYKAFSSR